MRSTHAPLRYASLANLFIAAKEAKFPYFSKGKHLGYVCNPRSLKEGTAMSRRMTDEIGIPTKAPQELPLPVPCVGLLILPIRQTIGPGYTQRRSTTAVPRATQQ